MASLPNLRDLGGWSCPDGQVRRGLVYRSTDLSRLTQADAGTAHGLGVRTVLDLRTQAEREQAPDRSLDGVEEIIVDVLGDSPGAAPARVLGALADPDRAAEMLGGGRAVAMFETGYRQIVSSPSALDAYHLFFTRIAQGPSRPLLFHCTSGKDRTGWGAACLLMLLGVSAGDVQASKRPASTAVHCYGESRTDLVHPHIRQAAKPLDEDSDGRAFDRVKVDRRSQRPGHRSRGGSRLSPRGEVPPTHRVRPPGAGRTWRNWHPPRRICAGRATRAAHPAAQPVAGAGRRASHTARAADTVESAASRSAGSPEVGAVTS